MKTEIKEADLQLVVQDKTLGCLTTNAMQIKSFIESILPNYDVANYNESNIDKAKKDKAILNKASKALNSKRVELEKEFMNPFSSFKGIISDTINLINKCSSKIDTVVKESEKSYKDNKRKSIQILFDSKKFTLVSLDKIFNEKWLNKTIKEKDINADLDEKIAKINDDIVTLEAIGEDVELLKSLYLDTLNINSTIQYANTLKQNRERASAAEAEKARREAVKQEQAAPIPQVNITTQQAPEIPVSQSVSQQPTLLTRAFRVTGTREDIIALGDFMNNRGLKFEKLEI